MLTTPSRGGIKGAERIRSVREVEGVYKEPDEVEAAGGVVGGVGGHRPYPSTIKTI